MATELLLKEKTRTADAVLQVLAEAGIDMVFGISGGHTGRLFTALANHQNEIRTLTVRHEALAGVMAEVYGRLTRKPGVIIGQGPWVLGNGLLGTMEALLSSSPMLLLTDFSDSPGFNLHGPYQAGTGDYGVWNARQAFAGVTKQVFEANDPAAGVQATQLAIKHALSGQPGPVAVLYASAGLSGYVDADTRPRLYRTHNYLPRAPQPVDPQQISLAAQSIAAASKPVIIAGNGVRIADAYAALSAFAEASGVPVVTTASGKGCFREDHDLRWVCSAPLASLQRTPPLRRLISSSSLVRSLVHLTRRAKTRSCSMLRGRRSCRSMWSRATHPGRSPQSTY